MQNNHKKEVTANNFYVNKHINNENTLNSKNLNSFTQPDTVVAQNREFGKDITNIQNIYTQNPQIDSKQVNYII